MGRNHIKRLAIPKSWDLERKSTQYIIRSAPGPHGLADAVPLAVVLKDMLGLAKTSREVKYLAQQRDILVDAKRRKAIDFPIGLMDTLALPQLKQCFRMVLNAKGKFTTIEVPEAEQNRKICRIIGKRMRNAKDTQLTLSDGRSITCPANAYKVGDSLLIELPSQKVVEHFPLSDGATAFLIGGTHCGVVGTISRISGNMINITANEQFQTPKRYVFVVGKDKPAITLEAKA